MVDPRLEWLIACAGHLAGASAVVLAPGSVGHRGKLGRGRVTDIRHAELGIEAMVLRDAAGWASEHGVDLDDPFAVFLLVTNHGTRALGPRPTAPADPAR